MPKRILFVCLGNICRSPMAEGLMQAKLKARGLDWEVASRGTDSYHVDEAPDARARQVMQEHGIDIAGQRAQQFTYADYEKFDHILTMDRDNYETVRSLAGTDAERDKVEPLLQYAPGEAMDVPDPYWNDDGFEQVYAMIEQAVEGFIAQHAKNVKA